MRLCLTVAAMLLGLAGSASPALSGATLASEEAAAACWNEALRKTDPKAVKDACSLLMELAEESYCHLVFGPERAEANRGAAYAGDANAQYKLGCMYRWGAGTPPDETEVWKWWRKAADQGHFRANARLIQYYQARHDRISEYVCIAVLLAYEPTDTDDQDQAEFAAWRLPSLIKSMTPAELEQAKAKALAATWKPPPQ